jgi:hypothetical protein
MKSTVRWIRAHKIGFVLACVFAAGLFLRIWGIASVYQRIDDIPMAKQIYHAYLGDWKPDPIFFYPVFFAYIVGAVMRVISGFLAFLGVHQTSGPFEFTLDQVLLIARLVSAAMGALTILIVFKIGKKLFSETVGLAAAVFFGLSFVHILHSHQIVLDVPMTFFYALTFYFCVLIFQEGRWPHYLAAALFAGLTTATKYNGFFIVFSIFAAHVWKTRETQKNLLKILFHKKIWAAGFVTILSFFAGHPYAFLWFQTFLRSTKELAMWVHAPEWYTVLVKPQTLWEKIIENKYIKGLGNLFSAEGLVFFLLIALGVVWILLRRKKETIFLSVSGLIYFLGALGYVGFSRYRDLSALALFYSFFAAFGLMLIRDLLRPLKAKRAAFAALAGLAVAVIGVRTFVYGYYLHEDDTTQVAERWVRRNIPAGSTIGREWFTPDFPDPGALYRIRTQTYLFQDFPPFDKIDVVESSSASNGFFMKYRKYYPDQVAVYDDLERNHELLKDFYFKDFEYKNPEVKIYSGKVARRAKQRLDLPFLPADPKPLREFDFVDGSPYGKDVNAFYLAAGERVERILVSRTKIRRLAIFVGGPESDGEITVRNGRQKKTVEIRKGRDAFIPLEPTREFPFFDYMYKVDVRASDQMAGAFVKVLRDDFDIALEYFHARDYSRARESFLRALDAPPPGTADAEIYLYLAHCAKMTGKPDEERHFAEKFSADKLASRMTSVYRSPVGGDEWDKDFWSLSGVNVPLFLSTQTILIDDDQFTFENGSALESDAFSNRKAWRASPGAGGALTATSVEKRLPPSAYRAEFCFFNPSALKGEIGQAEILFGKDGSEERRTFPLRLETHRDDRVSRAVVNFKKDGYAGAVRFRLRLSGSADVAFDRLELSPDLRAMSADKGALFQDYLK